MTKTALTLIALIVAMVVSLQVAATESKKQPVHKQIEQLDSKQQEWLKIPGGVFPEGLERKRLHKNSRINAGVSILKFPKGYIEPCHYHTTAGHSVFILKGKIKTNGRVWSTGHFIYTPVDLEHGPNVALEDTEILIWSDGPLDLMLCDKPQ